MRFVQQTITDYTSTDVTESINAWGNSIITAGTFVVGKRYTIVTIGTTDFTLIGATSNTIGLAFTATGIGTGTGTAQTTYIVGDEVLYGNYIWKNSFADNTNNIPSDTSTKWVKWGVSNKYSLIDLQSTTKTVCPTDMTVEFPRNYMDTIIIGNFTAYTVTIELLDSLSNVLNTQTFAQSPNDDVVDYYTYMYTAYTVDTDRAVYFDILPLGTTVRITFTKGTFAQVEVGFIIGGQGIDMGCTLEGVKIGFTSYSTTTIDDFGIMKITKRAAQDLVDFDTLVDSDLVMNIKRKAKLYRDEIVGFIVDENKNSIYENIVTLGVMQDIQPVVTRANKTVISWSILESI